MPRKRVVAGFAFVIAAGAAVPIERSAPPLGMADHTISGISAWSEAKKNGFQFRQTAGTSQRVTSPYDGVATYLQQSSKDIFGNTTWTTIAAITGGAMSVYKPASGSRTVTFNLFTDRVLTPGWTIVSVDQSGGTWDKKPATGSSDLSMRIKATAYSDRSGAANVSRIVLRGPDGQSWTKAFEGRKLFTITGINAWNTAKSYGFTFTPVKEHDDERISNALDGVNTLLTQVDRSCLDSYPMASVVGGNMNAHCAWYDKTATSGHVAAFDMTRDFVMFGGKRLAQGWVVREVVVSGGSWVQQVTPGSDKLEFVYRVTLAETHKAQSAIITRVVLEGPTSASSYADAFKGT
jgi:hypothetical protein